MTICQGCFIEVKCCLTFKVVRKYWNFFIGKLDPIVCDYYLEDVRSGEHVSLEETKYVVAVIFG